MAKPYKYQGVLGRHQLPKIPLAGLLLYPDDERWRREAIAALEKHNAVLIAALLKHCGVRPNDPDRWRKAFMTLARRHVPAFQPVVSRGPGRPPQDDWPLAKEVTDRMRNNPRLSIRAACTAIAKERRDGSTAKQIENRFYYTMRSGKAAKAEVERMLKKSRRISPAKSSG